MDEILEFDEIRKKFETLTFPWEERRIFPRRKDAIPVRFMGEETESTLFAIDVGEGGVRLTTSRRLEPKKSYEMELLLEGLQTPVRVKGEVAWQRPLNIPDEFYEAGLMFREISPADREALSRHAKRRKTAGEDDKRKHLRLPWLLGVTLYEGGRGEGLSGIVLDLSQEGARFLASRLIPARLQVTLEIKLEKGRKLTLSGSIMWGHRVEGLEEASHGLEFVHGVKFHHPSEEARKKIEECLKDRARTKEFYLVQSLLHMKTKE